MDNLNEIRSKREFYYTKTGKKKKTQAMTEKGKKKLFNLNKHQVTITRQNN
jgi:hypothetical protein